MNQHIRALDLVPHREIARPSSSHRTPFAHVGAFSCKFILDEPGAGATCCGAPTDGKSWCRYHQQIVYEPRKVRIR
ncbi:hypothetical protein [Consotaella aegiceratis]|uniref:hypothetical protein n=1 Tax=Consotaella aegiceratis TaxID=3097961 RepID=UPI002F407EF7